MDGRGASEGCGILGSLGISGCTMGSGAATGTTGWGWAGLGTGVNMRTGGAATNPTPWTALLSFLLFIHWCRSTHHSPSFFSDVHTHLHITALPSSLMFIHIYTSQPFLSAVHTHLHITALPSVLLFIHIYTSWPFLSTVHTDLHITAIAVHTELHLHITAVLSFLILIQLFCSHSSSNWTEAFQKQKERKKIKCWFATSQTCFV